ncbi:hypothetical protein, partial [Pseudomonas viridiflava]|uniref:hypothetical protein n=1 Tax=Pseudomonas viridiflava TaxID=33069 RepID=UPI0019816B9F
RDTTVVCFARLPITHESASGRIDRQRFANTPQSCVSAASRSLTSKAVMQGFVESMFPVAGYLQKQLVPEPTPAVHEHLADSVIPSPF